MKVNTDAVLLGAWASVPGTKDVQVLDIGTGTGVIALAIGSTESKSTSPHNLPSSLLIPTSTTTASLFTISPVKNFAFPTATAIMSAFFVTSFKLAVFE